jgi:hypothetical protein
LPFIPLHSLSIHNHDGVLAVKSTWTITISKKENISGREEGLIGQQETLDGQVNYPYRSTDGIGQRSSRSSSHKTHDWVKSSIMCRCKFVLQSRSDGVRPQGVTQPVHPQTLASRRACARVPPLGSPTKPDLAVPKFLENFRGRTNRALDIMYFFHYCWKVFLCTKNSDNLQT